jgi:sialidase-1
VGQRFAQAFFGAGIVSRHYGKLVFIGDSITQGGNGNPSYRYRVFENLANRGVPINPAAGYEFTGSVSGAYASNPGSTPDVNGQVFANIHDGHWGWRAFWENGRIALPANRRSSNRGEGTILNWTGQANPQEYVTDSGTVSYPDPAASGTGNTGATYLPDTAVIMVGINDLAGGSAETQVRDDIGTMIDQLQAANASVSIFLSEILHTNQGAAFQATVDNCNALLPALAASKTTATSPVWVIDTNNGFDPVSLTYDAVHPNAAGEDFVGDRISGGMAIIEMPEASASSPPGTEKSVGEFEHHYEGNEIWDTLFQPGWGELNGGGTSESLVGDGSDLRYDHGGSGVATTLDGTGTPWNGANDGDWTFETRLKFNANPSGFVLWLCTGSNRALIEIYADRTQDFGDDQFNIQHNNADGKFHEFRVAHDSSAGVYHVWRDGVELTNGGAPYDQAGADSRMLLGDYTSGGFGNNFDVEIDYVAFDQTGVYLPVGDPADVLAKYDADEGNPATAIDIESPTDQGWAEEGSGGGVVLEGVVDGGTNAWRISDGSTGLNPAYNLSLSATQLEQMYQNGWQFELRARAVQGGGFGAWGVTAANDPGWGLTGSERVGFGVDSVVENDAFQVTPTHGGVVTLVAGSASTFHTIRAVGAPLSSQYEFFVDGVSYGFFDIKDGGSNANFDDVVRFASGSTGGSGREVEWNLVCLEANQPPILVVSDGVNQVNEQGATSDDFSFELRQEPTDDVILTVEPLAGSADLDLGAGPGVGIELTFTDADWNIPQQVTVTAVDDSIEELTELVVVQATATSMDPFFDGAISPVTVTVIDNDLVESRISVQSAAFVSPKGAYVTAPELYHTFRIPSMIVAPDGSLLAWAEGRRGDGSDPRRDDNAPIDLVMKRSTDNGATWGPIEVIDPGFQPNGWKVDFGDPTTVIDETTDPPTLILLYGQWQDFGDIHPSPGNSPDPADANQVVWVRRSTDSGQSWSGRSQIIYPVGPAPEDPVSSDGLYWRYANPGPGNGIQLAWQEGANAALNGRLVIPAKRAGSTTPAGAVTTEPLAFYSDDHGVSWQIGNPTDGPDANEDEVVELTDGQLLLDARQNSGSFRRRHLSTDGGVNWGADFGDDVAITAVDTSLDRYSARRDGDDRDRILFSGPRGGGRNNITVWTSYDEGGSFINPVQLDEGFAAYSVVRTLPNGDIGVLVETDTDDGESYGKIEYFGFGLEFLEGMAHPEDLAHYDGFGNRVDRARGGTGWTRGWTGDAAFSGQGADEFGGASVGFDGFDRPRLFGRMDLDGGRSAERELSRPIDLGVDGCAYVSLLVSRQLDSSADDPVDEELRVELRDSGSVVHAVFGVDSDEAFFVDGLGARQAGVADAFALGTSHLLVMKVVCTAGAGDQLLLKAYPSGGFGSGSVEEDVVWTVAGTSDESSSAVIERIAVVGGANSLWSVDEIRIGESWESVAGEDTDGDGLDDAWEIKHFGGLAGSDGTGDADRDGRSDADEHYAGTDPRDGSSFFSVSIGWSEDDYVLTWPSRRGLSYRLDRSPDLEVGSWVPEQAGILATPPENVLMITPMGDREFYRIGIE